jgi:hypothetical protein
LADGVPIGTTVIDGDRQRNIGREALQRRPVRM